MAYQHAWTAFLTRRWALPIIGLLGTVLSLFTATKDADQFQALERLRFEQALDAHLSDLRSLLRSREALMQTVATLFNPGDPIRSRALGRYGQNFLALSPEVTAVSWLPQVPPERAVDALRAIAEAGVEEPFIFGQSRRSIEVASHPFVPHVTLDVEPKDVARVLLGESATDWPERRGAIERARATRHVITSGPTQLFQPPHSLAFLLYAPVFFDESTYLGAICFTYQVEHLFADPSIAAPDPDPERGLAPFSVHIYHNPSSGTRERLIKLRDGRGTVGLIETSAEIDARRDVAVHEVTFGGLPLQVIYVPSTSSAGAAWKRVLLFSGIGIMLTLLTVLALQLVLANSERLAQEVAARRTAEERLHVVVQELNHRVRNLLTIAQSVIVRSLRPGVDVTEAKATLMGRFEALAQVMGILTDGEWKGAGLKEILEAEMRPFAGRYQATGPSLMLTPRAAQTMTLAIHELVTNSAKHGALSRDEGSVSVTVGVEDSADGPIVRFEWLEQGGPPVQPPTRRGFGVQLLERIAPGDLSGQSELVYHPDGFSYRLTAPLIELEQRQP